MAALFWHPFSGTLVLAPLFWHPCFGTLVLAPLFWSYVFLSHVAECRHVKNCARACRSSRSWARLAAFTSARSLRWPRRRHVLCAVFFFFLLLFFTPGLHGRCWETFLRFCFFVELVLVPARLRGARSWKNIFHSLKGTRFFFAPLLVWKGIDFATGTYISIFFQGTSANGSSGAGRFGIPPPPPPSRWRESVLFHPRVSFVGLFWEEIDCEPAVGGDTRRRGGDIWRRHGLRLALERFPMSFFPPHLV